MENDMKELSGVKVHCAFEKAVDVVDLVEHPRNPNKHADKQTRSGNSTLTAALPL